MREGKKYEFWMNIQDKFTRAYETIIDVVASINKQRSRIG